MRSSKRPKNLAEGECYDILTAMGLTVTKRGCPDFFCFKGNELMIVECKRPNLGLKEEQTRVMRAFVSYGIKCFIWRHGLGLEGLTLEHPYFEGIE